LLVLTLIASNSQNYFITLRTELLRSGVAVTVVCPSLIDTNIVNNTVRAGQAETSAVSFQVTWFLKF
jgi:short-subunit dehydrogenase